MKHIFFLLLIKIVVTDQTIFDINYDTPIGQSKNSQCGCNPKTVDAFSAPDYGDSSKAGFYYRIMLEESKQIASWWVAGANLMVERNPAFLKSQGLVPKNFKLYQVNTKSTKTFNIEGEFFQNPSYKTVNICPKAETLYTQKNIGKENGIFELPYELSNTFTSIEFGDWDTNHLRLYIQALSQSDPILMQTYLLMVSQEIQMDTYFDSFEMRTFLSFLDEICFTIKNKKGVVNLKYTYQFLQCYYEFYDDDEQIKSCLTDLFEKISKFCKKKDASGYFELITDMGLDTATPFLRALILFGINYTRTIHETIQSRCDQYKSAGSAQDRVDGAKKCKLKAADVQSRKDIARLGYTLNKKDGVDDFIAYGFCQLDSFPLTLQISFDLVNKEGEAVQTESFQFAMWINLKTAQAKAKKQAIDGGGIKNCGFIKEQFPFQKVLKTPEMNTICNKTVQVIQSCLGEVLSSLQKTLKGHLGISNPGDFCLDKPFYDNPGYFVKLLRKPKIIPKPKIPEPEPEPEPPLFYNFTCNEFELWINQILNDDSIKDLFNSMNEAFNTVSDKDQSQIDLNLFIELWNEFKLQCEDNSSSTFYKIQYPYDIQLKNMIYKYTSGYIKFKDRISIRVSFYMLTDTTKSNPNHPKPFNNNSTQFCFEIEKTLTSSFESYFECNIYPNIDPPLGSSEITWDYNFQVYINFFKTYFMYLWKLKTIINYELTPFKIYDKVFKGLDIKAKKIEHKIILAKNGTIINENGLFINFKLEGFELVDFALEIRNEGQFMTKTIIKVGYIEYYFYSYKFFEYGASFRGGKQIDMAAVENKLQEIISKFLKNDYMDMIKVFFVEILSLYSTEEYKNLMIDMGLNVDINYGLLKNYIYSDLMSFKIFAMLLQYNILSLNFDMIDLERFGDENLQKVMEDKQEFYYFKEGQNYDNQLSHFQGISKEDIIFDKPVQDEPQKILQQLQIKLFEQNNLNLQKPLYFLIGLPTSHTKILITIYEIEGSLINMALMIIESQFYYKEILIPFTAPFLISQKIIQVLMETQKNEIDYLDNYLFNKGNLQQEYTIDSVQQLLEEANKLTNYKLPFCSVLTEDKKMINIYVGQPTQFKHLLQSKDYTEKIQPCKSINKMVKVISIQDTVYGGIPAINITLAEPNKKSDKIKLNFSNGVFMKRQHFKQSMQTQLIFYKNRQKEDSQILKKFLISHLKHFVEDEFDKLDEDIENKIKEFFKIGNQFKQLYQRIMLTKKISQIFCISKVPNLKQFLQSEQRILQQQHQKQIYNNIKGLNFYLRTYGCQMNQSDSEIINSILQQNQLNKVDNIKESDICIINTCAIRENAEQKIWNYVKSIKYLKKQKKNNGQKFFIGIVGCMAERLKQQLVEQEKQVDLIVGPDSYKDLPRLINYLNSSLNQSQDNYAINTQLSIDETYSDIIPIRTDGVKAMISIMRGCANICSYCIVPFVRGVERSRSVDSIVEEVQQLYEQGIREVTLLGQNVNSYFDQSQDIYIKHQNTKGFDENYKKRDKKGLRFAQLLQILAKQFPNIRFRFTSPHPKDFPDQVIQVIKQYPNICQQLHIPAQSGSNKILQKMNRKYTKESYLQLIQKVQQLMPKVSLSSDFIVGFCDETNEDFQHTLDIIDKCKYDQCFNFAYSMREKTPAYRTMQDNISEEVKQQRLVQLIDLFKKYQLQNMNKLIGSFQLILIENEDLKKIEKVKKFFGKADNGKITIVQQPQNIDIHPGDYIKVKIIQVTQVTLFGEFIEKTTIKKFAEESNNQPYFFQLILIQ